MSDQTNIFDQTEPTVLAELERVVKGLLLSDNNAHEHYAYSKVLTEINRLKPAEIDQLLKAFAEGGSIPQSAESWVKKFKQGG